MLILITLEQNSFMVIKKNMEIKVCEYCKSMDTSEDISTGEHTCLKCGRKSKGSVIEFYGVKNDEKIVRHSPYFDAFKIQTRVKKEDLSGKLL